MFHINLKNRRLTCGLSQKQVADYLNITPQSVSKWENGDAVPSINYLPKLAECLNCDINTFFAPPQEKVIDNTVLYDILTLMNDVIYHEAKTLDDVAAFENIHPSSISCAIAFCEDLMEHKTMHPKLLQGMLGCSEAQARSFIEQLIVGEMLEKLDIDDTYFVMKDVVRGFVVLLTLTQTICENLCDTNIDFEASLYSKIDELKRKQKGNKLKEKG